MMGAPASSVAHVDPTVVTSALKKLEADMVPPQKPTAHLVKLAIKLILAEKELEALKTKVTLTAEKVVSLKELYGQTLINPESSSSRTTPATEAEALMAHLTTEELAAVRSRMQPSPASSESWETEQEMIPVPKSFMPPP